MNVLITTFLIIAPYVHSSDQFLKQCQEFRNQVELEIVKAKNQKDYPNQCLLRQGGFISYCMSEENFKNYIKDITLSAFNSNKETRLYNDKILRCSFFAFDYVRLIVDWRGPQIYDLLMAFENVKYLLEQNHISDDKYLRGTLRNIKYDMENIQYADSFNITERPTRIELNDILNNHLINQYGLPKETRIDFIRLMLKEEEYKRVILAD